MAKRINITISDDLFDKLQEVKESLNVSGVCQEAIAQAVKIEELKKKPKGDGMEAQIERLRAEKYVYDKNYETIGFEDALEEGPHLPYEDLVEIVKDQNGNRVYAIIETLIDWKYEDDPAFEWIAYTTGFIHGIIDFWNDMQGPDGKRHIEPDISFGLTPEFATRFEGPFKVAEGYSLPESKAKKKKQ